MRLSFVVFGLIMLMACGKVDPVPQPPGPVPPITPKPPVTPPLDPKTSFVVNGVAIEIQGTLKTGATVPVDRAEQAVKTAVGILEGK